MPISREKLHRLVEDLSVEFAASIRRGLDHADTGQTLVCRDYNEMVEKTLGA